MTQCRAHRASAGRHLGAASRVEFGLFFSCSELAMPIPQPIANQQTVGNIGLFYVCYRLSRLGWNVMPTARNARGIDILIYSQDATRTQTLQVKALSRRSPVPLGGKLEGLLGDFFIVCRNVALDMPQCFVLTP